MKLSYSGGLAKLKAELETILWHGSWKRVSKNHYQCKITDGPVLNFWKSTGTILVQGSRAKVDLLMQDLVDYAASDEMMNPKSHWIYLKRL